MTARRALHGLSGCVALCAALSVFGADAEPPTPAAPTQPAWTPSESPPPAGPSGAQAPEPPVTQPPVVKIEATPPVEANAPVRQRLTLERLVDDTTIADLALVLFALAVTLFAWRVGSSTSRLRATVQRQAEDHRKVIEASETAAEAARRSSEAAEQTLGVIRETAERQLRAYVTVKQFVQAPFKDERENMHGWLLQVVWQNTGATPTKGFRYWAMLREFDAEIPDDFEFTPAGLKDFAGGELGTNSNISSPPLFVSPQMIAKMRDGSRRVLLLGQAGYSDFGAHHARRETRFCVEVVLASEVSDATDAPFSFVYYPRHNYST